MINNMKEQDLIDLGFTKEADYDNNPWEYHYYVYDFGIGLSLISNSNDEAVDGEWYVDVFEEDNIRFTLKEDLEQLINLLNKNKK